MKEVKTYLPEDVIARLDQEAKQAGMARSELVRNRLTAPKNVGISVSTGDFHKTVTEVRRRYSYGLDRAQAESLVAAVIVCLSKRTKRA